MGVAVARIDDHTEPADDLSCGIILRMRYVSVLVAAVVLFVACSSGSGSDLEALGLNNTGLLMEQDEWQKVVDRVCAGATVGEAARWFQYDFGGELDLSGIVETIDVGVAATCPNGPSADARPLPRGEEAIALQARVMERACVDRLCEGRTVMVTSGTPASLVTLLEASPYFPDLRPVDLSTIDLAAPLPGGAMWMSVQAVRMSTVAGVVEVSVSAVESGKPYWFQYWFQWDGGTWVDAEPEDFGVTVVTSVS